MGAIDPSLGFDIDFPSDEFRAAIHMAQQMGAPPDDTKKAVFVFKSTEVTYSKNGVDVDSADVRLDPSGRPLDPEIVVTRTPGLRVDDADCAVEISRADADELPVGPFRPTKATVTLLDVDYAKVKGCKELEFNGDRYGFGYEPDGLGLFDVGINTMIFYAIDEK